MKYTVEKYLAYNCLFCWLAGWLADWLYIVLQVQRIARGHQINFQRSLP